MSEALVPLLALLVKSTLIVLAAGVVVAALKTMRIAAAARHFVWLSAFTAIALLPVLTVALPDLVVALPYSALGFATPDLSIPGDHGRDGSDLVLVWGAYALGACVMLARLATARLALSGLWRRARICEGASDLDQLARACGVGGAVELRVADAAVAPLTWGKCVLLPPDAPGWPAARVRDVLLHELSHVARRDSLTQLLAAIVRALFWFSPAVWLALRELRIEQEHACDARALAGGAEPVEYAQTLLDVAAGVQAPSLGMGVSTAMVQASNLERRVVAVLAPERGKSLSVAPMAALSAVVLVAGATLAAARPADSARTLEPLAPLPALTTQLAPLATPLPRLTGRIDAPDEQSSDSKR